MARRYLAPYGRWDRVDNPLYQAGGWPDIDYMLFSVHGYVELKLIPSSGRPPDHFTLKQLVWGEREAALGGLWFLLGLQEGSKKQTAAWVLYDAAGARAWRDGSADRWLFRMTGRFPAREVLERLAPRALRSGLTFPASGAI